MGKTITPMAAPKSASDLVKTEPRAAPVVGGVMRLDDLPDDRSALVEERFAKTVGDQMAPPDFSADAMQSDRNQEHVEARSERLAPIPVIAEKKKLNQLPPILKSAQPSAAQRTEQISSPIEATLRQKVRDLRGIHRISEAFTLEYALRALFNDRNLSSIAAELKDAGGGLRRDRGAK